MKNNRKNAVIVGGIRTPFLKRGTAFRSLSARELGIACVSELLQIYGIHDHEVDAVICGQVVPSFSAFNIAREIALGVGLSPKTDAFSLNRACASGYQAVVSAVQQIEHGKYDCIIAGGADSASQLPVKLPDHAAEVAMELQAAKSVTEGMRAVSQLKVGDLKPELPAIREFSTGLTMGESAEIMAKANELSRDEQDDFAHRSHQKAAAAWTSGKFEAEVMTVYPPGDFENPVKRDGSIRFDSDRAKYAALPPAFDTRHGTITAGNSSPLSDGASAVLVASEEFAAEKNLEILGRVLSYSFSAVDPADQLLIGPVYSLPDAVRKAGVFWKDVALFDIHEAFAAQILSVLKVLEQGSYGGKILLDADSLAPIAEEKLNVNGGSIAIGHPFAATGGRQIVQTLHELRRRKERIGVCSACAAGGLSAAVVLDAA